MYLSDSSDIAYRSGDICTLSGQRHQKNISLCLCNHNFNQKQAAVSTVVTTQIGKCHALNVVYVRTEY